MKVVFVRVCESPPWYRVMIYILHTPKGFHTDPKLSNYARPGIVCPLKQRNLALTLGDDDSKALREEERETDWMP